jgi:hypothetical protein
MKTLPHLKQISSANNEMTKIKECVIQGIRQRKSKHKWSTNKKIKWTLLVGLIQRSLQKS